ncbi:MAG: hypothetical protein HY248_04450, partial [Fimbriimonas ginsengisoli]|nr:hypothetical protein [Fimbriimonas ginsengisoli]
MNAGKLFAMETDGLTGPTPLLNGVVLQQQTPVGGFSNASLNGVMVTYLTARTTCGNGSNPVAVVLAGLLTADGNGNMSLSFDQNCGGATYPYTSSLAAYVVGSNGRSVMTFGPATYNTFAYLVSVNQAFFLGTDSSGFIEPQTAGSFTNSAVQGPYAGSAISPATSQVVDFSGEFTADGASPTGTIIGSADTGASSGPISGSAFNATYSISSSPTTNGRGTMTITSGSGGSAVVYVVSPSKFVVVPLNDPNPAVWIFERSPYTLTSLTLSPSSVTGGSSSTGTVTLNAAAPAGGAQVALSSSNTTVAQAPASVTVPAGATSATFTVTTSAVGASTSVTISASYSGVTQTAPLTVLPPTLTLTSLTL